MAAPLWTWLRSPSTLILALLLAAVAVFVLAVGLVERLLAERLVAERLQTIQRSHDSWLAGLNRTLDEGEANLLRYAAQVASLADPGPRRDGLLAAFASDVARDPDGAWRSRAERFAPDNEAGLWVSASAALSADDRVWLQQLVELTTPFGNGAKGTFFGNTWLLTEEAEVVFDPDTPGFIAEMPATLPEDYRAWIDATRPDRLRSGSAAWMPMTWDPEMKAFLTSVVVGVERGGRWVGSAGHDMTAGTLLDGFRSAIPDGIRDIAVIDGQGQFIASQRHAPLLAGASAALRADAVADPRLRAAVALRATGPSGAGDIVMIGRLRGPGWRTLTMIDEAALAEVVREPFTALRYGAGAAIGVLLLLAAGALAADTARRNRHEAQLRAERAEAEAARERAERADAVKQSFLATMSHELHTPLTGVIGAIDCLEITPLSADQRELIDPMRDSAQALHRLVEDLRDFHAIDSGLTTPQVASFDLEEMTVDLLHMFQAAARGKGLTVDVRIADGLARRRLGDGRALRRAVAHVIGNAVKFTARGAIAIDVGGDVDRIAVRVHDTGIGMARELVARLNQPFTQADTSLTRSFGGTGIGLPLCHRLIALLGGSMHVDTAPGEGTTVTLTVPMPAA